MRLERISAKGLKGLSLFTSGVAFDFDALPPGLIAVVGGNGQGKTTFLELPIVALYGTFPSRPDNSLIASVDGRDAFVDLEAVFDGRGTYRARVSVDAIGRATDGVLTLVKPDGSIATLNDGKISTFRETIARELPPLELVLASAFAAQGRTGSFATLGKKERKDLFAALLGLNHYEQLATTARAAAGECMRKLDQLRGQVETLRGLTDPAIEEELSATGNRLQAEMTRCEIDQAEADQAIASGTARVDELQKANARFVAADAEHKAMTWRLADVDAQVRRVRDEAGVLDEDERREAAAIRTRRDAGLARIAQALAAVPTEAQVDAALHRERQQLAQQLAVDVAARETKIANNRSILIDRADVIRAAAAAVQEATSVIACLQDLQEAARVELARRQQVEREDRTAYQAARQTVLARERDHETTLLMAAVPCGGAAPYDACQFLQHAAAARDRLAVAPVAAAERAMEAAEAAVTRAVAAVDEERERIDQLGRELAAQRQVIALHDTDAKRLPALEQAEARVHELEAEIADLRRRHDEGCARAEAQRAEDIAAAAARRQELDRERLVVETAGNDEQVALVERLAARRQERAAREQALAGERASIEQQLAALARVRDENAAAHDELITAEAELAANRTARADLDRQLARIEAETRAFEARRAEYSRRTGERRAAEIAIRRVETDLVEWQALAKILGRDGLPVLEIDAAGPGVSALANDLLQACFGARFQVELVTQEAKADGKGFKEVFELKVYDAARDAEPRDLTDLSGGEQVIVDEAIKSAIALFVNQRNELPIRTCWRDETIGALDPENALRYVAMLRRLRERGGFHHVLFISHNLDAAALADAQLVVAGGRIDVRYPPFAATEAA